MKKRFTTISLCIFAFLIFGKPIGAQEDYQKLLASTSSVLDINITVENENWRYLLDSLRYNGQEVLSLENFSINTVSSSKASMRYSAMSVFKADQKRNDIDILLEDGSVLELSSIKNDPSQVREVLASEIYTHFMPSAASYFARLTVNDRFYGLMVIRQSVDQDFIKKHFNKEGGSLYKLKRSSEIQESCSSDAFGSLLPSASADSKCLEENFKLVSGSSKSFDQLEQFINVLNDKTKPITSVLDVDNALWMLALNNVLVNLSSYSGKHSQNYYLYCDKNGKFSFIPFDFNSAFGGNKRADNASDLSIEGLQKLPLDLHKNNPSKPLINRLLSNEKYYTIYASHCKAIFSEFIASGSAIQRSKELSKLIQADLAKDENNFSSPEKQAQNLVATVGKKSQVPGIEPFVTERKRYLRTEAGGLNISAPRVVEYNFEKRARFSNEKVESFKLKLEASEYTKNVRIYYRFIKDQNFVSSILYNDGQHGDQERNDQFFTITINPPTDMENLEFYFELESSQVKGYAPSNYVQKVYSISLDELNK